MFEAQERGQKDGWTGHENRGRERERVMREMELTRGTEEKMREPREG